MSDGPLSSAPLCGRRLALVGVAWYPYYCPVCNGGKDDPSCLYCSRQGLITAEQAAGWGESEEFPLRPVPRPPGVRRTPCKGCAVRAGSPEQDRDYLLDSVLQRDKPFWCHKDLPVVNGGYAHALEMTSGVPIGALVCAGWFDWMATGALPRHAFIDDEDDADT